MENLGNNEKFESENLNELFAALSKAQDAMEIAKTDNNNPFFKSKYADLASVVRASRKFLSEHGLCVIQRMMHKDGETFLLARLGHSSGQWIESKMPINPAKSDIQSIGSYITYLRRYTYAALVGVVASEEDDDGEKAMSRSNNGYITKDQVQELRELLSQLSPFDEKRLLKWCQVDDLAKISVLKFDGAKSALIARIKKGEDEDM